MVTHRMFIIGSMENIKDHFYSARWKSNFLLSILFAPVNRADNGLLADRCKRAVHSINVKINTHLLRLTRVARIFEMIKEQADLFD